MQTTNDKTISLKMVRECLEKGRVIDTLSISPNHPFAKTKHSGEEYRLQHVTQKVVYCAAKSIPEILVTAGLGFADGMTGMRLIERCVRTKPNAFMAFPVLGIEHLFLEIDNNLRDTFNERIPASKILLAQDPSAGVDDLGEITNLLVHTLTKTISPVLLPYALAAPRAPLRYELFSHFVRSYIPRRPVLGTDPFIAMLAEEASATLSTALERRL